MNVSVESDSVVYIILYNWISQRNRNQIRTYFSLPGAQMGSNHENWKSCKPRSIKQVLQGIMMNANGKCFLTAGSESWSDSHEPEPESWAGTGVMSRNLSHGPEPEQWPGPGAKSRTWSQEPEPEPWAAEPATWAGTAAFDQTRLGPSMLQYVSCCNAK